MDEIILHEIALASGLTIVSPQNLPYECSIDTDKAVV